jgi:hypothetical protein
MTGPFDRGELRLYLEHIWMMAAPHHRPSTPDSYAGRTRAVLDDWPDVQLQSLIDEGRRQLDDLNHQFENVRSRGQYLVGMILLVLAFVASRAAFFANSGPVSFTAWYLGGAVLLLALLGAVAVFATTGELGSIDTVLLAEEPPGTDLQRTLATAYPSAVRQSANAVRLRFTLLRDATWFAVLGILVVLVTWFAEATIT